jgi:hypothetical protein
VGGCPLGKEDDEQPRVPIPLVRCEHFSQVLLDRFDIAPHDAIRLGVQGCGACLVLIPRCCSTSDIRRVSKLRPGHSHCVALAVLQSGRRSWSPGRPPPSTLLGWGRRRPPAAGEVVYSDHQVSITLIALTEGACYINCYPLERGPDVPMLKAPTTVSWAATGCAP